MFFRIIVTTAILSISCADAIGSAYCSAQATSILMTREKYTCPSLIDLDPIPENHPWTHATQCIDALDGTYGKKQAFCLYTKANSKSGRGYSIVTSPEFAQTIVSNDSIEDYHRARNNYTFNDITPVYEPRQIIGRGVGLFATVDIQAGQVILAESPVLIAMRDALAVLTLTERQEMQWRAVLQLPQNTQKLIRNLAKSRGGDEIEDIIHTNSIGLTLGDNYGHLALVPEAARINHSCRPNAYYRFNETTYILEVFALRNIEMNEEISFSYGYAEMTREARQQYLKSHWAFDCVCTICSASAQEISSSDARLKKINDLKEQLSAEPGNHSKLLEVIAEILQLFDEEGLIRPKAKYYEIATYAANRIGDEEQAISYGKLARWHWSIMAGPQSWEVQRMEELLRDPKRHPSWQPRVNKETAD